LALLEPDPKFKKHRTLQLEKEPTSFRHAWHSRRPHQRHCGTGIGPDRDIAAGWREIETPCASLPTRSPSRPRTPARKTGVLDLRKRMRARDRLAAGGRWIRSYGGLRLPKKAKDSAILGVAIKRFCPRFCPRVAIRVYPGSRSRTLVDPATECLPGQYALIWTLEMERRRVSPHLRCFMYRTVVCGEGRSCKSAGRESRTNAGGLKAHGSKI
jgi:hypothetical protein